MIVDLFILSLSGSLVFASIWIMDRSTASVMKTAWRRLWWLAIPAAFLVPLEIPVPVPGWAEYKPSVLLSQSLNHVSVPPLTAEKTFITESRAFFLPLFFWLGGAAIVLGVITVQTFRASRRWSRKRLSTDSGLLELLEDCKTVAGITTPIGLVVTDDLDSPALLGWLRPRILLPEKMAGASSRHLLKAVFFHELAHFRNGDIPVSWLFVLVRTIHWFNPLAHRASRCWEAFREEAADETAIGWMQDAAGQSYGQALLDVLHNQPQRPVPQGALSIGESLTTLKRRMIMIKNYPNKRAYPLLGLCLGAFVFFLMLLTPVPAESNDPESIKKQAVASMEVWLKTIDGGKYGQSWTDASDFFKKALTEKQWIAALEGVRTPLGKCNERKLASAFYQTEVPAAAGKMMKGNYVIAQFHSSYDGLAQATETLTFEKEADGSWKASGYYIKPKM